MNDASLQFPYASPEETTTFSVAIANVYGIGTDEMTVEVHVPEAYASEDGGVCQAFGCRRKRPQLDVPVAARGTMVSAGAALRRCSQRGNLHGLCHRQRGHRQIEVTVYVTDAFIEAGPDRKCRGWFVSWAAPPARAPAPAENVDCDTCLTPVLTVPNRGGTS